MRSDSRYDGRGGRRPPPLEHEKQERTEKQGAGKEGRHDAAARQGRRRSRGSDGGLTGHGCARSAEIVGRIVLRGHPLHAANACVKYGTIWFSIRRPDLILRSPRSRPPRGVAFWSSSDEPTLRSRTLPRSST